MLVATNTDAALVVPPVRLSVMVMVAGEAPSEMLKLVALNSITPACALTQALRKRNRSALRVNIVIRLAIKISSIRVLAYKGLSAKSSES